MSVQKKTQTKKWKDWEIFCFKTGVERECFEIQDENHQIAFGAISAICLVLFKRGYSINVLQTNKRVFRPPEANNGCMIKPFEMKSVQISSSKPPMLNYASGENVVNTR